MNRDTRSIAVATRISTATSFNEGSYGLQTLMLGARNGRRTPRMSFSLLSQPECQCFLFRIALHELNRFIAEATFLFRTACLISSMRMCFHNQENNKTHTHLAGARSSWFGETTQKVSSAAPWMLMLALFSVGIPR